MQYSELLDKIIKTLEANHLCLYHSVSKEEIYSYVEELKKKIDDLNRTEFDYEMCKLFAKFKDGHTAFFVPFEALDKQIKGYKNKLYVEIDGKYVEILEINGVKSSEVIDRLVETCSFETKETRNWMLSGIKNAYRLKMLGIMKEDKLDCLLANGKHLTIKNVYKDEKAEREKNYYYTIQNNILYLKYFRCQDEKDMPFADLVKEMAKKIKECGISQYILDLRGNGGGNSEILNPFQDLVKKKKLQGVLLTNNGVFSSGRFAVARFKQAFNTPIIGEATGGAAKSYGYCLPLKVDNVEFCASIRLWDFSKIFGYEGAIQPDIYVEQTLKDLEKGRDRVLETAYAELAKLNIVEV